MPAFVNELLIISLITFSNLNAIKETEDWPGFMKDESFADLRTKVLTGLLEDVEELKKFIKLSI